MARVGSVNHQVGQILKARNGIGESKRDTREASGLQGENGHKVSDKFHSYKSMDNARADLKNLGRFAKEHGIKDMSKIDQEIVRDWIYSKDISYSTASNYLSEINKVSDHLSISRDQVKELRQEMRLELRAQELGTRAYKNVDRIEVKERSEPGLMLQREYGLRVREATHVKESQLQGNTLTVQGKGGYMITKELSPQHAQQLRDAMQDGKYSVNYKTYSRDLKEGVERTGQEFKGTHGLRHSFAQGQITAGKSKEEVSKEMGHVREEITNTYLR